MAKYVDKYPHPGPRPPDEDEPGTFSGDSAYKAWRDRAERLQAWSTRMRQHVVAAALDALCEKELAGRRKGGFQGSSGAVYRAGPPLPADIANAAVWSSYLQEPLPKEFFP